MGSVVEALAAGAHAAGASDAEARDAEARGAEAYGAEACGADAPAEALLLSRRVGQSLVASAEVA